MGLRSLYNAIDGPLNRWWSRMSIGRRLLALFAWACVLVVFWVGAFAAYLHYLIRTGQFID